MTSRQMQDIYDDFRNRSASLTMLNLSGRGIGNSGVKNLAESCIHPNGSKMTARPKRPYNCPVVCLWLENNELSSHAMNDLARLMNVSPYIRQLFLAHNSIHDEGITILTKLPIFRRNLDKCDLSDNAIGPLGAQSLSQQVLIHPDCRVQSLNLDSNCLGDEGIDHLLEGLKSNTSLRTLDIRYNRVTSKSLESIRNLLASGDNMTIQNIYFREYSDDEADSSQQTHFHRKQKKQKEHSISLPGFSACECYQCQLKGEIDFYLQLNCCGRHSWKDLSLPLALWPRILAKCSGCSASLVYSAFLERPDVGIEA